MSRQSPVRTPGSVARVWESVIWHGARCGRYITLDTAAPSAAVINGVRPYAPRPSITRIIYLLYSPIFAYSTTIRRQEHDFTLDLKKAIAYVSKGLGLLTSFSGRRMQEANYLLTNSTETGEQVRAASQCTLPVHSLPRFHTLHFTPSIPFNSPLRSRSQGGLPPADVMILAQDKMSHRTPHHLICTAHHLPYHPPFTPFLPPRLWSSH